MMKMCPLCNSEMPARYNYCFQCGEFVGDTGSIQAETHPEDEAKHQLQERVIQYGCFTLIIVWTIFGLWFCVNMNR